MVGERVVEGLGVLVLSELGKGKVGVVVRLLE